MAWGYLLVAVERLQRNFIFFTVNVFPYFYVFFGWLMGTYMPSFTSMVLPMARNPMSFLLHVQEWNLI